MKLKVTVLLMSLPAVIFSSLIATFNVLAALGHGRPLDLFWAVPFLAVPMLWCAYAVGEK